MGMNFCVKNLPKVMVRMVLITLLLFTVGCSQSSDKTSSPAETTDNKTVYPLTVNDDLGRQVTIKAEPQRIVSIAPSNTEILFYLGLGNRVVGDTKYCDYPEEAKLVEKVGGFKDPSLEKIVSLKPDLVLATGMHAQMVKSMEEAGLTVIVLDRKNVEGIVESMQLIGKIAGVPEKSTALTNDLQARIKAITQKTANIPENQKPTVYYELWYEPLMSVGKDTLIGQIITMAGGQNIAADGQGNYPQISEEIIVARNPQIMLNSYGHDAKIVTVEEISQRKGWSELAFVKSGKIYTVESDTLTIAGPRIVNGLEQVAKYLHPELFQ